MVPTMRAVWLSLFLSLGCASQRAPVAPAPTKPAPVAKRPPRSGALFTVAYEALLPVACYDAKRSAWGVGAECVELLPDGAVVALESGRTAKTGGRRVPTITDCALDTPLVMFDDAKLEKPGSWAIWPPVAQGRARRLAWESTKKGADVLGEADRARLGAAMTKLAPSWNRGGLVSVVQTASADLDADGASEIFFSATGGGFDPAARTGASALFVGAASGGPLTAVRTSDHAVFRVEGVVDVDDDGLSEAWISARTFHASGMRTDAMLVARPTAEGLATTPPVESCWPPGRPH